LLLCKITANVKTRYGVETGRCRKQRAEECGLAQDEAIHPTCQIPTHFSMLSQLLLNRYREEPPDIRKTLIITRYSLLPSFQLLNPAHISRCIVAPGSLVGLSPSNPW